MYVPAILSAFKEICKYGRGENMGKNETNIFLLFLTPHLKSLMRSDHNKEKFHVAKCSTLK